ncbi:unnamed protein product [Acanthoscelides obtectus]|uniref:Uncharacterized protein n=1 Tax=Acanthoscelides obtectus TaxID=200917 RepID=A0A9P0PJU2_ACAOB|nr:unnamed protein product [Acanthoscelides obtectus]CAK1632739.1 hypothetical protein AOBTE_LOCUS7708 [Acanthoscelides obtectus]
MTSGRSFYQCSGIQFLEKQENHAHFLSVILIPRFKNGSSGKKLRVGGKLH